MLTRRLPCLVLVGLMFLSEGDLVRAEGTLALTSPAFQNGQPLPARFARASGNVSPELQIPKCPRGAQELVLICDDPDAPAGDWTHWVLTDIPPATTVIPEGNPASIGVAGKNSWGQNRYDGPQPPSGTHRYFFKLYALKDHLAFPPSATRPQVLKAMQGSIVAEAELMGTYSAR